MATREENLKKINEELEKLDDEQLEEVAGGGWGRFFKPANSKNLVDTPNQIEISPVEACVRDIK